MLDGDGVVLLGDDEHPVRAGSVVARPPATGVAHGFEAGEDGMTLLAYGTRDPSDMCWYPDSSKVAVPRPRRHRARRAAGLLGRRGGRPACSARAARCVSDVLHAAACRRVTALLARRLLVVTGKGGVGKTTVAAALGLVAARAGKRTIVAEVARRGDVASAFDRDGSEPFEEIELAPGLFHISIDPQDALEEYLRDQLPRGPLADLLARSRVFGLLAAATPGMRELLTVGKLWELAQLDRRTPGADPYDLVVVDAPATGHGVAVLTAPRTFAAAAGTGPVARQGREDRRDAVGSRADRGRRGRARGGARRHRDGRAARRRCARAWALRSSASSPTRWTPTASTTTRRARLRGARRRTRRSRARCAATSARCASARSSRGSRELCEQEPARLELHPGGPDLERLADELAPQLDVRRGAARDRRRRAPRRHARLHRRRLRRRRQDDRVGRARARARRGGQARRGRDDRPGEAARRVARPRGARQRPAPGRPRAARRARRRAARASCGR